MKKTSNKAIQEKTNKSSVYLLSMISTAKETDNLHKNENPDNILKTNFLQPLDVVIQEARHQLSLEKLREEKLQEGKYFSNFSCSEDSDDYEEMESLQTFYKNIYEGDYMDMGLV